MKQLRITEIGKNAVAANEPMLILFNQTATEEIRKVAVIHEELDKNQPFVIKKGDKILFGEQEYHVEEVGELANNSLEELGHVTIVFHLPTNEHHLPNSIYLLPSEVPEIKVGMTITFQSEG